MMCESSSEARVKMLVMGRLFMNPDTWLTLFISIIITRSLTLCCRSLAGFKHLLRCVNPPTTHPIIKRPQTQTQTYFWGTSATFATFKFRRHDFTCFVNYNILLIIECIILVTCCCLQFGWKIITWCLSEASHNMFHVLFFVKSAWIL